MVRDNITTGTQLTTLGTLVLSLLLHCQCCHQCLCTDTPVVVL